MNNVIDEYIANAKDARKQKILEFIHRRFPSDCHWTDGNCYWFATILRTRFSNSEIYYLPTPGHFVTKIDDEYYDFNGIYEVPEGETIYSLRELYLMDSVWFKRIIRDCVE